MRRRDLLASIGSGAALEGLNRGGDGRRRGRSGAVLGTGDDGNGDDEPPVHDRIEVGDPDAVAFPDANRPHTVSLLNDADRERPIALAVERDDETVLEREVATPGGSALEVVLYEPASYRLGVTVEAAATDGDGPIEAVATVERRRFDCVASRTVLTIRDDGVESCTDATVPDCDPPAVAGGSLERGEDECAAGVDDGRAAVEFGDGEIAIEGVLVAPTPCHEVALAEATLDEETGSLEVVVAVGEGAEGACIQCLGAIDYRTRIAFDRGLPDRVDVVHETWGERSVVASAENDG